ncbi:hypothetical protein D3C78_1108660 [compost metagenome]
MLPRQLGRQGAGHRRMGRAYPESTLFEIALIRRLGGEPATEHLVQCLGPFGRHLQPIGQGSPLHLLPQNLVKRGEAGLQFAHQAALLAPLRLECLVAGHRGLPLFIQLGVPRPGELQLGRQGIQPGLQIVTLPS